jgi:hypothetical protein
MARMQAEQQGTDMESALLEARAGIVAGSP